MRLLKSIFYIIPVIYFTAISFVVSAQTKISFTDSLPEPATISAGLYKGDSLVRTIFNNKKFDAGEFTYSFSPLTDQFKPITSISGLNVKVLKNNVKYDWAVIGNTSDSLTGSSKWHNYGPIRSLAFAGNFGYAALGYNERKPSYCKFNINTPKQKIAISTKNTQADFVCTDGVNVYWACNDPYSFKPDYGGIDSTTSYVFATRVIDDSEVTFKYGARYTTKKISSDFNAINITKNSRSLITGIAIGKYLYVARKSLNLIDVLDKTGALINQIPVTAPKEIRIDSVENLYVISGTLVKKFTNFIEVRAYAFSAPVGFTINGNTLLVAEGAKIQQIKAIDLTTGVNKWYYGQAGGYYNGPDVSANKFYFNDVRDTFAVPLAYQSDGTFWVGDPGNTRVIHFTANRTFINSIAYRPISYSSSICAGDSSRLFSDYCEYKYDYKTNKWTFVKNWGNNVPRIYDDAYYTLKTPCKLSNGRTYAFLYGGGYIQIVELTAKGLRFCQKILGNTAMGLYRDGIRIAAFGQVGSRLMPCKRPLAGFDKVGNPIFGTEVNMFAMGPIATSYDPLWRNSKTSAEVTSSGLWVPYDGNCDSDDLLRFHLGAVNMSTGKWVWRSEPPTHVNYQGDLPTNGAIDIGNNVVRGADTWHHAIRKFIFTLYHGEFWKNSQTNMYNLFYDNGLMLGQFGAVGGSSIESPYGMAGNNFGGGATTVGNDIYLLGNDEGHHAGMGLWRIYNTESVSVKTVLPSFQYLRSASTGLMEGLPFNKSVTDSIYGWRRYPKNDDLTSTTTKYWRVKTSVKTYDRFENPDIYAEFRQASGTATLTHLLTTDSVSSWNLSGNVSWEANYPSTDLRSLTEAGEGGQFLEVVDDSSKPIFRLFPMLNYNTKVETIYCNNVPILTGSQGYVENITSKFFHFEFSNNDNQLSVIFNGTRIPVKTLGGNTNIPKNVRLFFWTNTKNASRKIAIKGFEFSAIK